MTNPPTSRPDPDALEQLRSDAVHGDEAALEQLLAEIRPMVLRRCAKLLPCPDDADEACQDALLAVSTNLSAYVGSGSFKGWIMVIASNSARATYRRLKRRSEELATTLPPEAVEPRTTSVIAGSRIDLLEALDELEAEHPELIESLVLRDIASLSYAEVADQTGVPLGTAQARIHRARKFLRPRLSVTDS